MGVGAERRLLHLSQQLPERHPGAQPRAQRERVHEEADQALQLDRPTAGDGRADDDVVLARVARHQDLERGEERHERRHPFTPAERLEGRRALAAELHRQVGTAQRLHRRARPVRGQLQRVGRAGERLLPPGHLLLQRFVAQPSPLPGGVVRVLELQRRQRRRQSPRERHVDGAHLADEDADGPAVRHDVVEGYEQDVALPGQAQQGGPYQRGLRQVEGRLGLGGNLPAGLRLALGLGQVAQVHHLQRQRRLRVDVLHGRLALFTEGGAQRLVTVDELLEGASQRLLVQRAVHPDRGGDVVEGAARLQPVEEPQALLREGQRQGPAPRRRTQGRQTAGIARHQGLVDHPRERLQRGRLEQQPQRQVDAEVAAHACDGLGGDERVAAQLEEAVVDAHPGHAQQRAPLLGEDLLRRGARRHEGAVHLRGSIRRGQRLAVHLPVGRQRQRVQPHQGGRHHVLGQPLAEELPQRLHLYGLAGCRHRVAHQPLAGGAVLAHHHHRVPHGGVCGQRGLDLAQLDAEATHLHLRVHAPQEVQLPAGAPLHPVSRAVQARSGLAAEGVGHEALGRQLRTAQVAPRHSHAAEVQLARHSHGDGLQPRVQHVRLHVGQRPADGRRPPVRLAHREGRHHGALGGAVGVEEASARAPPCDDVRRAGLATGDDGAQRRQPCGLRGRQRRGREAHRGNGLLTQEGVQRLTRHQPLQRRQVQRSARAERGEDLLHRDVEAQVGELQHPRAGAHLVLAGFVRHQVAHAPVLHQHALGLARGAGGVDDVRGVPRGGPAVHRLAALRRQLLPLRIQQHHARRRPREARQHRPLRHQGASAAVLQHEGQALPRQGRVQRQVRAARVEDAHERHHQLQRALHAHADDGLGAHTLAPQTPRELIRPVLQLRVRQLPPVHHGRYGLRGEPCLLPDERAQGGVIRELRARAAPLRQQRVPLVADEQLQP